MLAAFGSRSPWDFLKAPEKSRVEGWKGKERKTDTGQARQLRLAAELNFDMIFQHGQKDILFCLDSPSPVDPDSV